MIGRAGVVSADRDRHGTRSECPARRLGRADLHSDPIEQFARWLKDAEATGAIDPTAMALATVGPGGVPSQRIVLLKYHDRDGFCWYTDYRSRKGKELAVNPCASLLFHWSELDRQVRVTGRAERLPAELSEAYFSTRPPGSRLSAAASLQSHPVSSRRELERQVEDLSRRYPEGNVPRPEAWGGYRLRPEEFEFWQGRANRLHDRFRYRHMGDRWMIERLSP